MEVILGVGMRHDVPPLRGSDSIRSFPRPYGLGYRYDAPPALALRFCNSENHSLRAPLFPPRDAKEDLYLCRRGILRSPFHKMNSSGKLDSRLQFRRFRQF